MKRENKRKSMKVKWQKIGISQEEEERDAHVGKAFSFIFEEVLGKINEENQRPVRGRDLIKEFDLLSGFYWYLRHNDLVEEMREDQATNNIKSEKIAGPSIAPSKLRVFVK